MLTQADRGFAARMLATPQYVYRARLEAILFANMDLVVDAGCGFGQWSAALAALNGQVVGVDANATRIQCAGTYWNGRSNLTFATGRLEALPLESESADAIFCYSVIYLTNVRAALREMRRVLRPQGRVYICTNGWGWRLSEMLKGRRPPPITPWASLRRQLNAVGLGVVTRGGEGTINYTQTPIRRNYLSHFMEMDNVYELIAIKL